LAIEVAILAVTNQFTIGKQDFPIFHQLSFSEAKNLSLFLFLNHFSSKLVFFLLIAFLIGRPFLRVIGIRQHFHLMLFKQGIFLIVLLLLVQFFQLLTEIVIIIILVKVVGIHKAMALVHHMVL
jgi:hypothetical protein